MQLGKAYEVTLSAKLKSFHSSDFYPIAINPATTKSATKLLIKGFIDPTNLLASLLYHGHRVI